MKSGIIGLPGAGKTTVFEALTHNTGAAVVRGASRIGTVDVPDHRVDVLTQMYVPRKTIYARVEYLLPASAQQTEGANREQQTWNQVRDCDALIHVVRNFRLYGAQAPDAYGDFLQIDQELMLLDQVVIEKRLDRLQQDQQRGKKVLAEEVTLLKSCLSELEAERPLRKSPELAQAPLLRGFAFFSAKPMLVLFNNMDDDDATPEVTGNRTFTEDALVIKAKLEQELVDMPAEEAQQFLTEFNISANALQRVLRRSLRLMGLIAFFTVGEDEVRAWTIREGTAAQDAAEVIHSDIKKGFIRAEVLAYSDLMAAGSHADARKQGLVRLEGKTYTVQDGDVINYRFNV